MRKVLLVLNGIVAKEFLTTLILKHLDKNAYIFVSLDSNLLPKNLPQDSQAYNFDPSASNKLKEILTPEITDCYVVLDDAKEREVVYHTLRSYSKMLQITMLGEIALEHSDKQLLMLNEAHLLSSRLFEKFPNVPKTAKSIGLGQGEIMQVSVPFGSPYAYRSVGVIKQKKWKIVAIYRNNALILPKYSTTILPNDALLLVGEPDTLWEIYHRIKEESGQFPTPFGRDVILYFDLLHSKDLEDYLQQTIWLFKHFKNKRLKVCFFNPTDIAMIKEIENHPLLNTEEISWHIEYHKTSLKALIEQDKASQNIGLILLENYCFERYRGYLLNLGIPLLRFGEQSLQTLTHSVVVLPKVTEEAEKISSVVFDFSTQLGLKILLYDFDPNEENHEQALDYYKHIAKVFNKKLEIDSTSTQNPILWLNHQQNMLQILPLRKAGIKRNPFFSMRDVENLSAYLVKIPQLFVPISV
ncbi:TrkA C-terminal domain-containing protein [uncultured Helicobacter sp.]|uniref:TrkA C-terminal domain-containing protein n=1 Tax=uncultured Helicobacter sp. TaxID=175537 RepID=UPI00260343C2|nr:TrkA C-terminal domain-containing protein [uncultured Helicobacter sp.]